MKWRLGAMVTSMVFASGAPTWAGPDFIEVTDAGSNSSDATAVIGDGPLTGIRGSLDGQSVAGDFEDMFLIRIVDPESFNASTAMSLEGFADFDTQLWLFGTECVCCVR